MTDPKPDEVRTDAVPESDRPGPGGEDSVMALHRAAMDVMNDPVTLSAEGTPDEDEAAPGGQDTVQRMQDILMREQAEPRDGFEPVPFWVAVVCGGLLLWGGYYLGTNSADFRADVDDTSEFRLGDDLRLPAGGPAAPDPELKTVAEYVKVGAEVYRRVCVACHKPDGNGDPSQNYPPLNGSEWVAGAEASPARQARIVLYGLHQPIAVKGRQFNGQMPAQGGVMKDYEIAAAITFARNSWDNKADPNDANPAVTTAAVKAAREKAGKRDQMTAAELQKLPTDYSDLPPAANAPKADGAPPAKAETGPKG
ncbi:MAG: cytochrome c [Gemmataceae bacterium]|nr:cytochrome c [Gemmataceae bacterium]